MQKKTFLIALICLALSTYFSKAQSQCLDLTFATAGIKQLNFGADTVLPKSIALQQDGKILVGSDIIIGMNRDFMLTRFNTDGSVDSNFGNNGSLVLDYENNSSDFLRKIIVQTDGKILLGGNSKLGGFHKYSFIRINSNGMLDMTFGLNGKISHSLTPTEHHFLKDMVINNNGKIAFVGHSSTLLYDNYDMWTAISTNYIFQLNTNGDLDTGFANGGYFLWVTTNIYTSITEIELMQNQDIIFSGFLDKGIQGRYLFVAKLNQSGFFDTTFGINGVSDINSNLILRANQLIVDINDNIYVQENSGDNGMYNFNLTKMNNLGSIDTNLTINYSFYFWDLNKKFKTFLVNSSFINVTDSYRYSDTIISGDFELFTLNNQGFLDANSCGQGDFQVNISPADLDEAVDAAQQSDLKIIQLGSIAFNTLTLIRYLNPVSTAVLNNYGEGKMPFLLPNPANSIITLHNSVGQIQIVDLVGKVISQLKVNQNEISIDISKYTQGLYFIRLIDDNQQSFNLKFIKE